MKNTICFLTLTLLLAGPASARNAAAINPKAQEMLKQSVATYAALRSYSCRITLQRTAKRAVGKDFSIVFGDLTDRITLAYQKPDHAAVTVTRVTEDSATQKFSYDGQRFYRYWPDKNEYDASPGSALSKMPPVTYVLNDSDTFFSLVFVDPAHVTTWNSDSPVTSLTLGPETRLYGVAVRTVRAVMRDGSVYSVTIGVQDHLWHHFVWTIPMDSPAAGSSGLAGIRTSETYTDINLNPTLPAAAFLPPAGAQKITDTKSK